MATAIVYCFYTYDPGSGERLHQSRAATLAAIERLNGVPMRETGIEVDVAKINGDGFFNGPAYCEDPIHKRP